MKAIVSSPTMNDLITIVEEGARANERSVDRFIEPIEGALRRAASRRHHIVFGRRGSGKTSLLRKAAADLTIDRRPIAYIDLEPYKGHQYPDVLITILIASFVSFKEWLETAAIYPANRTSFWKRLFGAIPLKPAFNRKEAKDLATRLQTVIADLETQLHLADNAELQQTIQHDHEQTLQGELTSSLGLKDTAQVGSKASEINKASRGSETQETFRRSKIDFLYRHIMEYQNIFKSLTKLAQGDAFLFLDDLYHIRRPDQAQLLDYFHRIVKGNNTWLKIGTIRHRSQWYVHSDSPIGLKLGDDADEINLDLTLEKYATAKDFLMTILNGLITESSNPSASQFIAEGGVDRLVLASGGVARDFLGIFRRSVDETRERLKRDPNHYRGPKIGAEDVNLAVGTYGDTKQEEFKRDTLEDRRKLERAFERIRGFCTDSANANCFLLDQDLSGEEIELIDELVDLRLIHLVRSRVTVREHVGRIYKAYMLDVSQYTGARKRRELEMLEFWRTGTREQLRRVSLVYDPNTQYKGSLNK
jgi:hypothetical protein